MFTFELFNGAFAIHDERERVFFSGHACKNSGPINSLNTGSPKYHSTSSNTGEILTLRASTEE